MTFVPRVLVFLFTFTHLSSTATSSASCNNSQLAVALEPLRTHVNYSTCQVDANAAAICASSACKSLMAPLAAFNLPMCQVSLKGANFNTFALKSIRPSNSSGHNHRLTNMDILNVDVLPPPGHDGDDEATNDHTLLRLHVSSTSLQDGSDDAPGLTEQDAADYDASQTPSQSNSHRSGAQRRRKIGKGIQLILLRKFVQCAKQFNKIPDRETTEQLLEQGYDEFYYQGGNLNEPRLSYTAFLKLVRNRRSEVAKQNRAGSCRRQRALTKKYQKEQMEIRALIDELEHVRHGQQRETLEYDALGSSSGSEHSRAVMAGGSVPILSDSSSIMGDAGTDGGVSTGDLSATETYSSVLSGTDSGSDDVVVSRSKLDLMLRVAQETLVAQKKILEERKPRPPHQKHRKRSRKKKRSSNQEEERPDPQAVAKANAEKVASALILAQERAKRIQQEKLQLEREQELERQEAACRLQEQMVKIEASESHNHDTESVWTVDTNDMMETEKQSSQFMIHLEAQLREKMSLEMHVKQSYIDKHKQRERVRLKLEKVLQKNSVQSSKVARLSAMKASLEMELAAVLEDTAHTRQKRRELELADEKERLKRQREAERALQIRLREEEWSNTMEEEKARSQVAAEARAKASKRVEAHSAKLRKMMHAYRYEPRHSSSSVPSSARSNNDSGSSDEESSESSSRASSENLGKPFKMDFLLRPELADFEEDGLCNNSAPKTTFRWQVPSFSDPVKFKEVLLEMVSDDEE
ncbi:hypothetical protein JG688_00003741 [Phytophthora aleatoria]|uniref:Uncharacterized protein n=1 Tax=Phytophthora aleatoria TaxID=2496075 RepID=A0A8J5JB20_9STRA|nr:hypothetical protein JG688_00003741 [Phytophthora aleatoria]